jgi:plastocyanin
MRYTLRAVALMSVVTAAVVLSGCGASSGKTSPGESGGPMPARPGEVAQTVDHPPARGNEPEPGPNDVVIDNFSFRPAQLEVKAGTKVTFINRDDVPHTATSKAKPRSFDSGTLDTDQQFTHVFARPGTYEYFCAVHPHMVGKIIVK